MRGLSPRLPSFDGCRRTPGLGAESKPKRRLHPGPSERDLTDSGAGFSSRSKPLLCRLSRGTQHESDCSPRVSVSSCDGHVMPQAQLSHADLTIGCFDQREILVPLLEALRHIVNDALTSPAIQRAPVRREWECHRSSKASPKSARRRRAASWSARARLLTARECSHRAA